LDIVKISQHTPGFHIAVPIERAPIKENACGSQAWALLPKNGSRQPDIRPGRFDLEENEQFLSAGGRFDRMEIDGKSHPSAAHPAPAGNRGAADERNIHPILGPVSLPNVSELKSAMRDSAGI
jgi:hypothetical protein